MAALTLIPALLVPLLLVLLAIHLTDLSWSKVRMLAAVSLCIAIYFIVATGDVFAPLWWRWSVPAPPPDEAAFIAAARDAHTSADAEIRRAAAARLCAFPPAAENWVGRVEQMYLDAAGTGASLAVEIWPHLVVRTAWFIDNTRTLIRQGAPVFDRVTGLRPGDIVQFSGRLVGHGGACPEDTRPASSESSFDPQFLFDFVQVGQKATD